MTHERSDPTDLADDDVRGIADEDIREKIYRVTEKIKTVLIAHDEILYVSDPAAVADAAEAAALAEVAAAAAAAAVQAILDDLQTQLDADKVPPGAIIAMSSNLTGSHPVPATGVVDDSGYMLCDGSVIPEGQILSGSVPQLTDNRFLMGSTSSGTTGGATTVNLQHSHTVDGHTHTGPSHRHAVGTLSAMITQSGGSTGKILKAAGLTFIGTEISTLGPLGSTTGSSANGTGAQVNGNMDFAGTGNTGSAAPSTNNGLSTSQENRPLFFSCQYLIKVS